MNVIFRQEDLDGALIVEEQLIYIVRIIEFRYVHINVSDLMLNFSTGHKGYSRTLKNGIENL